MADASTNPEFKIAECKTLIGFFRTKCLKNPAGTLWENWKLISPENPSELTD